MKWKTRNSSTWYLARKGKERGNLKDTVQSNSCKLFNEMKLRYENRETVCKNAYTKLSCKVPISGWSRNRETSFKGEWADLHRRINFDTETIPSSKTKKINYMPVHIPFSSLQFFWKNNTVALHCIICQILNYDLRKSITWRIIRSHLFLFHIIKQHAEKGKQKETNNSQPWENFHASNTLNF